MDSKKPSTAFFQEIRPCALYPVPQARADVSLVDTIVTVVPSAIMEPSLVNEIIGLPSGPVALIALVDAPSAVRLARSLALPAGFKGIWDGENAHPVAGSALAA